MVIASKRLKGFPVKIIISKSERVLRFEANSESENDGFITCLNLPSGDIEHDDDDDLI